MNFKEFQEYVANHVKDYLPNSYQDADIRFEEVVKNNDVLLTAIAILKNNEQVVPAIYLNDFYESYQNGTDIDEIVGEVADQRIENEEPLLTAFANKFISNYEVAKQRLEIRLCDKELNKDKLEKLAYTEHGDFAATYHVRLGDGVPRLSTPVTANMLEYWGITKDQLHTDALKLEQKQSVRLVNIEDWVMEKMFGMEEAPNLLAEPDKIVSHDSGMEMYYLTTEDGVFGASQILQNDLMKKIGELLKDDFYILPSSVHEVLLVPKEKAELDFITAMVQEVNETEISLEDMLSNKIQFYDRSAAVIENAELHESRLEIEKGEDAKAANIHQKLQQNKQKSEKMTPDRNGIHPKDLAVAL